MLIKHNYLARILSVGSRSQTKLSGSIEQLQLKVSGSTLCICMAVYTNSLRKLWPAKIITFCGCLSPRHLLRPEFPDTPPATSSFYFLLFFGLSSFYEHYCPTTNATHANVNIHSPYTRNVHTHQNHLHKLEFDARGISCTCGRSIFFSFFCNSSIFSCSRGLNFHKWNIITIRV